MSEFFRHYRRFVLVLVVVLLPLFVYRAHTRAPRDVGLLDRVILAGTYPLKQGLGWCTESVAGLWYRYVDVVDARAENAELRQKLWRQSRELDLMRSFEAENRQLELLLQLRKRNPEVSQVSARVIGAGVSPRVQTLELDKGSVDGVRRGLPVVASDGLVGVVQRTGWVTASVMQLDDRRAFVDARISRTRARTRLRGVGNGMSSESTEQPLAASRVAVGDRLESSGLDGVFPSGVPVGVVAETIPAEDGRTVHIRVQPHVRFREVEVASVLMMPEPLVRVATPEILWPKPEANAPPSGPESREQGQGLPSRPGPLAAEAKSSSTSSSGGSPR